MIDRFVAWRYGQHHRIKGHDLARGVSALASTGPAVRSGADPGGATGEKNDTRSPGDEMVTVDAHPVRNLAVPAEAVKGRPIGAVKSPAAPT
jgi:hypothetical protein